MFMIFVSFLLSVSLLGFHSGILPSTTYPTVQSNSTSSFSSDQIDLKAIQNYPKAGIDEQTVKLSTGSVGNIEESILSSLQKKVEVVPVEKPAAVKITPPKSIPKVVPKVETATEEVAKDLPDFETFIIQKCSQYGCNAEQLIRVMYCESGGRANAVNPAGPYIGLFQFLSTTFYSNAKFITGANIYNGYHQIEVAAKMFANGQAGQWGCK
jgi:Transglycosylase-like domain